MIQRLRSITVTNYDPMMANCGCNHREVGPLSSVSYFHAIYKYYLTFAHHACQYTCYTLYAYTYFNRLGDASVKKKIQRLFLLPSPKKNRAVIKKRERIRERERESSNSSIWNFHIHGTVAKQLRKVFIARRRGWRTSGCPRKKVACHEPIPSTSHVPNASDVPRNHG